jgi:hypothetical protein
MAGFTTHYSIQFPLLGNNLGNDWQTMANTMETALSTVDAIRQKLLHRPSVMIGTETSGVSCPTGATTVMTFTSTDVVPAQAANWVTPSSWHSNVTNKDQFVVPESGIYNVTAFWNGLGTSSATQIIGSVTVNGTAKLLASEGPNGVGTSVVEHQVCGILVLTAGDIVRSAAFHNSGSTVTVMPAIMIYKMSD